MATESGPAPPGASLPAPARAFAGARWFDVLPRRAACPALGDTVLLHAGPPYPMSHRVTPGAGALLEALPAPVLHAALQALRFEGMAADDAAARGLIERGTVTLEPAQDHGVATPLAQVVSASMPLAAVRCGGAVAFAPLVEGPAPALRFGALDPACRDRLSALACWARDELAPLVRARPVALDAVIAVALGQGDECHLRTAAANEALAAALADLAPEYRARLRALPAFVLPVLMAAAAASLRARGEGIVAIGGNGVDFGLRWHADCAWRRLPADPPRGLRLPAASAPATLGAIGDSAVIDLCGLGGQALAHAPQLLADWAGVLPADALTRGPALLGATDGIVDPARVVATGRGPLIDLAMLDRDGREGLVGRGFYEVPAALFATPPAAAACGEAYVRAALALHGYRLDEAQQARVRAQFDVIDGFARTVAELALDPGDEALPVFRPWPVA
jgi:hypothetical protein